MKRQWTDTRMVLLILLTALAVGMPPFSSYAQTTSDTDALFRVEVKGPLQALGLPIYGHLHDGAGNDSVLVIATLRQVADTGLAYEILDHPASPGAYYLALERRKGTRQAAAGLFTILHDDGRRVLVKVSPEVTGRLSRLGFDIKVIPTKPMVIRTPFDIKAAPTTPTTSRTPQNTRSAALAATYDPRVAAMIAQLQQNTLYDEVGNLSGENTVTIGGGSYTIETRHTSSGTPVQKATQYVYERMEAMGLTVAYHNWSTSPFSGRNVVGTKAGKTKPSEIVLITAHLDDTAESNSDSDPAPGADDNASGSAALLMAAEIMASASFERTLRFVFFTGEEQGLYGSEAYAVAASSADENIVAVYNMDMIAWDAIPGPELRLYTRGINHPGYAADMAIATTFTDVVANYGLSTGLTPLITADSAADWSDHASFWDKGYAAIVAIEEDCYDFNEYYHTADDTRQRLNMAYFTHFAKASVGTAAHLALPAEASEGMTLTVTREGSGNGLVTSVPAGIHCGTDCTETYAQGTEVTLTAVPESNSRFTGWSGGCSGTGTCVATMDSAKSVTANFTQIFRGDLNDDKNVNLTDAVLALKAIGGMNPAGIRADYSNSAADVNGDNKIGLAEVIYTLQTVAGVR